MNTAPKPPRARTVVLLVLFPLSVVNAAVFALSVSETYLTVFGLCLDAVGAVILVVPETRPISSRLYTGKLEKMKITLSKDESGYSGISAPEEEGGFTGSLDSEGFWELVETMSEVYDDRALGEEDQWSNLTSMMPIKQKGDGREEHRRVFAFSDGCKNRVIDADPQVINTAIRQKIDQLNGRLRRTGIATLVVGFLYQIAAQLL